MKKALRKALNPPEISVEVRPVSVQDTVGLRAMLSRLSPESVYLRFHTPRVPGWAPEYLADMRSRDGFALVAVVGNRIVGHAMYGDPVDGEAEIAVVVEDEWQAGGVGRLLVSRLTEEAGNRGVEFFTCVSLGENRSVAALVNATFTGAEYKIKDGARLVRVPLYSARPMDGLRRGT